MSRADIAVVGAGMAGASLAAELAPHASVLIFEAEDLPGYHSTGRSAAFSSESYGGPLVQPLTSASRRFLAGPPADFSERGFLSPRGAIHLADAEGEPRLAALRAQFAGSPVVLTPLDRAALEARIPGLRPGWDSGLDEPSCADIDVAGLHAAYLRRVRASGGRLICGARVEAAVRRASGWRIETRVGTFEAAILVDAAGAWADELATACGEPPLGITPFRRTLAQLRISPPAPPTMPLVIDARERFYFKPEAGGRLWLSPHDETRCAAGDCAAEEEDVAIAIDQLERVVDWRIENVERRWAGLRSFAPDRIPVFGFGATAGFFWCAGQGGFGIQTAPAAARLAAALVLEMTPDPMVAAIDATSYSPRRFDA